MSSAEWELVCGLEVHVHLKTRTKMFCRCELSYGAAENTHTCPVCLAHPGALPVPNGRAIEMTILLGLALDCEIAESRRLRPQELLLSRPAEGLPDQPVRGSPLRCRQIRPADGRRRARDRHRPRAPRGGRREDGARRRRDRPLCRCRLQPRRLQPRWYAAARDRQRARPALCGRGDGVSCASLRQTIASSESRTPTWRRERCAPTSTCRCGAPARRASGRAGRSRT